MSRKNRHRRTPKVQRRTQPGTSPGTIVVDPAQPKPAIHVFSYGAGDLQECDVADPAAAHALVLIVVASIGVALAKVPSNYFGIALVTGRFAFISCSSVRICGMTDPVADLTRSDTCDRYCCASGT